MKNVTLTAREDGKYDARFVLGKGKDTIMDITLTLDTEYQAKKMAVTFSEKPEMAMAASMRRAFPFVRSSS